jgi:hypothetical protein
MMLAVLKKWKLHALVTWLSYELLQVLKPFLDEKGNENFTKVFSPFQIQVTLEYSDDTSFQ